MPTTDSERRKLLIKNLVLWIVIVLVMLAVFSRYMPTSKKTAAIEAGTECLRGGEKVFCPPANGLTVAENASGAVQGLPTKKIKSLILLQSVPEPSTLIQRQP